MFRRFVLLVRHGELTVVRFAHLLKYLEAEPYVEPVTLETGRWRFREEEVERLMGVVRGRKAVMYGRVSSNTQRDHLVKS